MADRVTVGGLQVAAVLHDVRADEALPGSGIDAAAFWAGVEAIVHDLAPRNRELLARRDELQQQLDDYHRAHPGTPATRRRTRRSCARSATCVDEPADFAIEHRRRRRRGRRPAPGRSSSCRCSTPGSPPTPPTPAGARSTTRSTAPTRSRGRRPGARATSYNPVRGAEVIARGRALPRRALPAGRGHPRRRHVVRRRRRRRSPSRCARTTCPARRPEAATSATAATRRARGRAARPPRPARRDPGRPRATRSARTDAAGVKDLLLEAAVSTIMDLEDSVAAVDAEDKVLGYRNWLRLMQGTLADEVTKGGQTFTRGARARPDLHRRPPATTVTLPGRSLLFVRQVGHLMTTDAVLDRDGDEVPEGILDAVMTALGSLRRPAGPRRAGATPAPARCTS